MAEEKRGRKRERGEGREGGGNYLLASFSLSPLSTLLRCLSILHRGKLCLNPEGTTLTGLLLAM